MRGRFSRIPPNGFVRTTSLSVCSSDFLLRAICISVSKNKSSFPANGLFARRAPRATVWIHPNDSVHHEMMRLVSLSFRFRSKMAAVLSTISEHRLSSVTCSPFPQSEIRNQDISPISLFSARARSAADSNRDKGRHRNARPALNTDDGRARLARHSRNVPYPLRHRCRARSR